MVGKLKLKKSLALENFTLKLIEMGKLEIKEVVDYSTHKLNPQLLQDVMAFIDEEISASKYKSSKIDRTALVIEIFSAVFELSPEEREYLEKQIVHILDNGLLKKSILKKFLSVSYRFLKLVTRL